MGHDGRHIPNRLRRHRKMMGYTQKEVAKLLGVNATDRLSLWEKGITMPNAINLIKLSLIYHVFPTDLYYDLMVELRNDLQDRLQPGCLQDI